MTPKEYESHMKINLEGEESLITGFDEKCVVCNPDSNLSRDTPGVEDPVFSWHPCDLCGAIAGNRYVAHVTFLYKGKSGLDHFDICEDCVMYINFGTIPTQEQLNAGH